MAMQKEATETKWIQMAGKPNKDFLAKPKGTCKRIVKILAYADDIAVHLRSLTDIKIYKLLLRQHSLATGGVTNFHKSEEVTCGPWRRSPPDLGIKVFKASKYLGVITGNDPDLALKTILEREARVYRQLNTWDIKLSSSPIDKVMVAKIMCHSLVWYHAGIMPGWEPALQRIKNRVQSFISLER
jgi:hypothetical protein